MKATVLLLIVFVACQDVAGRPSPADNDASFWSGWRSAVGFTGRALNQVKQTATAALQQASGYVPESALEAMVASTLDEAIDYDILSLEVADSIASTFDIPSYYQPDELTLEEISTLEIDGAPEAAKEFISGLVDILQKQEEGLPRKSVLTLLEYQLAKLLVDNAVISIKGFASILSNLDNSTLVQTVRNPAAATKAVVAFINDLKPKLAGLAKNTVSVLINFEQALQAQVQAVAKFSLTLLTKTVRSTIDVAVVTGAFSSQIGNTLYSTFANKEGEIDIESLQLKGGGMGYEKFKAILNQLVEMKQKGTPRFILLGGLEAAVMNLLADKAVVTAQYVSPLLNQLGLSSISSALDAAIKIVPIMQSLVSPMISGAAKFYGEIKNVTMLKLQEGGSTTVGVLSMTLQATLSLASSNGLLDQQQLAPLAATFGVANEASPLESMDKLVVKGDETVASKFKTTLSEIVEKRGQGSASMRLISVNMAVLELLSKNGITSMPTLGGMMALFGV